MTTLQKSLLRPALVRAAIIGCFATVGFAQDNATEVQNYFDLLSAVTYYSPVDGAGSHSGLGMQVGAGAGRARSEEQSLNAAKAFVLQGLIWPFDVGLSAGHIEGAKTQFAGAHFQANIFEGFRLPAVAIRGHYSSTFGQKSSTLKIYGGDLVASYGFWRYVTLFGSVGVAQAHGNIELGEEPVPLILREPDHVETFDYSKQIVRQTLGLHMQILPGAVVAVFEAQRMEDGKLEQVVGKLAYGL